MARNTTVLQIFVASPSDVSEERDLMESVVSQLNQAWRNGLGVTYELVKWETDVRPAFSTDPQSSINAQIGNNYDVFIGIFWGRLGTATPRADSGTLEEFEIALARSSSSGGIPEIMLYFKDAPISPSKIDTKQLEAVINFKKSLSLRGGLYSVFEDLAGFESSLRSHLAAVAQSFISKQTISNIQTRPSTISAHTTTLANADEDDYGYVDHFEIYGARFGEMLSALTLINEATVRIGAQMVQRTVEMHANLESDPKEARRLLKRVADDMNSYADTMRNQLVILSSSRSIAFNSLSKALMLQGDFHESNDDLLALQQTLTGLIEGSSTATAGIKDMRASTESFPKISKEINIAKRAVVFELDSFLAETDSMRSTVINIIESIDRIMLMVLHSNNLAQ